MIPASVKLIVKAPNQQIDDQNVECQSSWTVKQLKGHLSQVYPSKPETDEQKIIYSGQLLDDNIVLKDVLRTYESQIAHTMHLVCTPKRKVPEAQPETPDGLRQRTAATSTSTTERPSEPLRPEMRQNDQNHTVEMQNYLSSFVNNYGRVPPYPNNYNNFGGRFLPVNNDPTSYAHHMMMMQQAYLQYMQQYANMWQATQNAVPGAPPAPETPPAAPQAPAPAPEGLDEEGMPRDWLDHLYAASRLAILFSLVYLYGSPARLLLVLLLAAAGYLHQIGFFRDLHVNANVRLPAPAPAPAPADLPAPAPAEQELPAQEVPARELPARELPARELPARELPARELPARELPARELPARELPARELPARDLPARELPAQEVPARELPARELPAQNEIPAPPQPTATPQDNDNQQSLLAVTWMIFTTFFASLIPENTN